MTTTTRTTTRNVYRERQGLLDDMRAARVAGDTMRGKHAALGSERKRVAQRLREAEMQVVLGAEGAVAKRDADLERLAVIDEEIQSLQRGMEAAGELVRIRQAQLAALYDEPEGFEGFCTEAQSATAGAVRDLQELRRALGQAARSWAKATSLWAPLNAPLRQRLQELNQQERQYPDVAQQAAPPPFPIALPSNVESLTPCPPGYSRLTRAQRS
jgi:chromosome segregation ATPase